MSLFKVMIKTVLENGIANGINILKKYKQNNFMHLVSHPGSGRKFFRWIKPGLYRPLIIKSTIFRMLSIYHYNGEIFRLLNTKYD